MKLSEYIDQNGLRQEWFAKKIGVTDCTLSLWINKRRRPSHAYIYMITQMTHGLVGESDWEIIHTIPKSKKQA